MLPFDVIDHILSFLQWDHAALTFCSEADPRLSRIAERHLYAHITVEGQKVSYSDQYTFDQFQIYRRLRDSPRIANYVRSIRIEVLTQQTLGALEKSTKQKPTIHLVIPMLPLLECITLACTSSTPVTWTHLPKKFRKVFMDSLSLPTIKELSLSDITDFPLSSFDHSQTLKKLALRGKKTFQNLIPPSSPRPSFDALSLYHCPPIQRIISWAKTQTLRSLEIGPEINLIELPLLLQVWSHSLTNLDLDLGYGFRSHLDIGIDTPVPPEAILSLPKLPVLEQITVRSIISLNSQIWVRNHGLEVLEFYKSSLPTITPLVFGLTSPSLKRIILSFHISFNGPLSFSHVNWSPLVTLSQLGVPLELRISANKTLSHIPPDDILRSLQKIDSLAKLVEQRALVLKGEGQHPFA